MSKKKRFKKQPKKAYSNMSTQAVKSTDSVDETKVSKPAEIVASRSKTAVMDTSMSYVVHDVKRTSMIVGGFLVFQLILAYILNHTAIGSMVYGLVKV